MEEFNENLDAIHQLQPHEQAIVAQRLVDALVEHFDIWVQDPHSPLVLDRHGERPVVSIPEQQAVLSYCEDTYYQRVNGSLTIRTTVTLPVQRYSPALARELPVECRFHIRHEDLSQTEPYRHVPGKGIMVTASLVITGTAMDILSKSDTQVGQFMRQTWQTLQDLLR